MKAQKPIVYAEFGSRHIRKQNQGEPRLRLWLVSSIVVLAAAATMNFAAAQLPEPETANGIEYITGGFGSNVSEEFKKASSNYPLALTFAASDDGGGSRPYVADVHVVIKDHAGNVVMDVPSAGPYFLAKLGPGRYTVEATYLDQPQTRNVQVKQGGSTQEVMTWKRP